LYKTHRKI